YDKANTLPGNDGYFLSKVFVRNTGFDILPHGNNIAVVVQGFIFIHYFPYPGNKEDIIARWQKFGELYFNGTPGFMCYGFVVLFQFIKSITGIPVGYGGFDLASERSVVNHLESEP